MKKIRLSIILLFYTVMLSACSLSKEDRKNGCMPPPQGFAESDLIGTWYHESMRDTDTLIIRDDGKYKQIIQIEYRTFDYESDWQAWWVEYAENRIPYLHLEGLRVCVYTRENCDPVPEGQIWYDFCQEKWLPMSGEGILMVLAVPERFKQPPLGIELSLLQKRTEGSWSYELQETTVPTLPGTDLP